MSGELDTCWTLIRAAGAGASDAREQFARLYLAPIRAYLAARWRNSPRLDDLDDATQEVFLRCLQQDGALERVSSDAPSGFRGYLYGVARNVALQIEARAARRGNPTGADTVDQCADDEAQLSCVFDRAWAGALVREAGRRMAESAAERDTGAQRRVELLRLRFHEQMPIRAIAALWGVDAAELHHQYATARREFREALLAAVRYQGVNDAERMERELQSILERLSE